MIVFPESGTLEFKAGVVEIENVASVGMMINVYVPNKDNMTLKIPAGKKVAFTTLSAGESFFYFAQASNDVTVAYAEEVDAG